MFIEELKVKSKTTVVSEVIQKLEKFCKKNNIEDDIIENILIACDEALTNIIIHAYDGKPYGDIEIKFIYKNNQIIIEMDDWGKRFKPPHEIQKKPKFKLDEWEVGGFGLILMNEFMDELRFSHDETLKRNKLSMTKYLD